MSKKIRNFAAVLDICLNRIKKLNPSKSKPIEKDFEDGFQL